MYTGHSDIDMLSVTHLMRMKEEMISAGGDPVVFSSGYLARASAIDRAIKTMLRQQTDLAYIKAMMKEQEEIYNAWTQFFGYVPDNLNEKQKQEMHEAIDALRDKWIREMSEQNQEINGDMKS